MLFILGLFILSNKTKILSRTAKLVLLAIWIIALFSAIVDNHVLGWELLNSLLFCKKTAALQ